MSFINMLISPSRKYFIFLVKFKHSSCGVSKIRELGEKKNGLKKCQQLGNKDV